MSSEFVGSDAVREVLERHAEMYQELLVTRFGRLIVDLNAG